MPMNEAQSYRIHTLSPEQEKEAMNSLYGLGGPMHPPNNQQLPLDLTAEELQEIRAYMAQQKQLQGSGIKEFDLAKPPIEFSNPSRSGKPYQFLEFPFLMYNHRTREAKPAMNHLQREAMLAEGWSEQPFKADVQEQPPLSPADLEAVQLNDFLLKMSKEERDALLAAVRGQSQAAAPEPDSKRKRQS